MAAKSRITIGLDTHVFAEVHRRAEAHGTSFAGEAERLIKAGLNKGVTPEELESALDKCFEREAERLEVHAKAMQDSVRQIQIARKNMGKTTKAAYGTLSLLAWLYHDFAAFLDAAGVKSSRISAFSSILTPRDIFKLFEGSGGALQADRGTRLYESFIHVMSEEPFRNMTTEELVGCDNATWDRLTRRGNDAVAVRSLADKERPSS